MAGKTSPTDAALRTADGLALHVRGWPTPGSAEGTVLVVHGLGEHIGRYEHVAAQFNGWGWSVVGYDQRGHGRSEGPRGRLNQTDDLLNDLALVIDTVKTAWPAPLVLLGHSLGGLVAARFVAGSHEPWWREVQGLVLSSPALDAGMSAWQKLLLGALGNVAPNLGVSNGLKPQWISRDPEVVRSYVDDPLVHDRIAPRLARFIADAGPVVLRRAPQWTVPTLLLVAGSDRCVVSAGSTTFAAAAPRGVVRVQVFEPLFHEIFNEPEQQQVFAVLREWLEALVARDVAPA